MNLLTDEECEIVAKLSKQPELILSGAGYRQHYYGVDRDIYQAPIEVLEEILKKWMPSLTSFCNFTDDEIVQIRVLCYYGDDSSFIGVHYLPLPSNKENDDG